MAGIEHARRFALMNDGVRIGTYSRITLPTPIFQDECEANPMTSSSTTLQLTPLARADIAAGHPVRETFDLYDRAAGALEPQLAPALEDLTARISEDARARSMLLEPVAAPCSLDFSVMYRGDKFPGTVDDPARGGQLYSHGLMETGVTSRLLELAATLALKQPGLSKANSARFGHVNVLMYRGVFPLWCSDLQKSVVLLITAPAYVKEAGFNDTTTQETD